MLATSADELAAAGRVLDRDGYVVVDGLLDPATADWSCRLVLDVWRQLVSTPDASGVDIQQGAALRAVRPELPRMHLAAPAMARLFYRESFVSLVLALAGPGVDLIANQAHVKAPGDAPLTKVPWHQDASYGALNTRGLNCWVALTDATEENGCLAMLPGSHARPLLPHAFDARLEYMFCEVDEASAVRLPMTAGQAVVVDLRTAHASGVNRTGEARVGLGLGFGPAHARLAESGLPFGDRIPIARGGRSAAALLLELAASDDAPAQHPGRRLVDELVERNPAEAGRIGLALEDLRRFVRAGQTDAALERVHAILTARPEEDEIVFGDRLKLRGNVDQVLGEIQRRMPTGDRESLVKLARRAVELDPSHTGARAQLEALAGDGPPHRG